MALLSVGTAALLVGAAFSHQWFVHSLLATALVGFVSR